MKTSETKKVYIETYGCQMNFSDSEIVGSILVENGFKITLNLKEADFIFLNTCSVRDHAEQRVRNRLKEFRFLKKKNPALVIGILGCMAERLKDQMLAEEQSVDMIIGPDAYRSIPQLIGNVEAGQRSVNVLLSLEETYADIEPVRLGSNGVSAFISIMRGCENYCSYCVVPFTRGQERSRDPESIRVEAGELFNHGYREVTLLGQNVNSYYWNRIDPPVRFADLLRKISLINPRLRIRFATSHPKDLSDEVIQTIAAHPNICKSVHLPVQSGSNRILQRMNRRYTREWYMNRIEAIRTYIPDCGLSTDIITGFCGETEEDHRDTISMMEWARFDFAYMFKYSERPQTLASRKYTDDVPDHIKGHRLKEIIRLQQKLSLESNRNDLGKIFEVMAEGPSRKSDQHLSGRNSQNKMVVFPAAHHKPGEYVHVKITGCTPATLTGEAI